MASQINAEKAASLEKWSWEKWLTRRNFLTDKDLISRLYKEQLKKATTTKTPGNSKEKIHGKVI